MASPELVNGIAKLLLAPECIATTRSMLEARLEEAMEKSDVAKTLAISRMIFGVDNQISRYAATERTAPTAAGK